MAAPTERQLLERRGDQNDDTDGDELSRNELSPCHGEEAVLAHFSCAWKFGASWACSRCCTETTGSLLLLQNLGAWAG